MTYDVRIFMACPHCLFSLFLIWFYFFFFFYCEEAPGGKVIDSSQSHTHNWMNWLFSKNDLTFSNVSFQVVCYDRQTPSFPVSLCVFEGIVHPEELHVFECTQSCVFGPVQRTQMTSSLPHSALLEDLSKPCGSALFTLCTLAVDRALYVFLCRDFRLCVHKLAYFYYLLFSRSLWGLTWFVRRLACFNK